MKYRDYALRMLEKTGEERKIMYSMNVKRLIYQLDDDKLISSNSNSTNDGQLKKNCSSVPKVEWQKIVEWQNPFNIPCYIRIIRSDEVIFQFVYSIGVCVWMFTV